MFGQCRKKSAAHVVGGGLVISLPGSDGIWRFDMNALKSAFFDIEDDKGVFVLSVKDGSGAKTSISSFKDKALAQAVLADIHFALLHEGAAKCPHKGGRRKWCWFLIVVALILAFQFLSDMRHRSVDPSVKTGSIMQQPKMGLPQPADDFFGKR